MIGSIRAAALLDGVRGRAPLARAALAELIERVSWMVHDLPEIDELDLNPVLAWSDRAVAVDARIRLLREAPTAGR